jgi:hypothetical protein
MPAIDTPNDDQRFGGITLGIEPESARSFFHPILILCFGRISKRGTTTMRADYATSDLISKVNSEWINEVLANREFGRADPGDDVPRDDVPADEVHGDADHGNNGGSSDLRLRREFARKRAILLQRGSTNVDHREPDITAMPTPRSSRQRSVARRIKERLALAIAALTLVAVAVWMAPEPQDVTNSMSARAASAAPEPAAPIDTTELQPAWLLPEILYGPAMARSPMPRAEAARSAPKMGR